MADLLSSYANQASDISGPSGEDVRNLLKNIRTYQGGKVLQETLGLDVEEAPKPGPLTRLFDLDTGILSAGGRGIRALTLDIAGYKDPNLQRYTPLESAFRSARGDFSITGGDIYKVKSTDSKAVRGAKLLAALGTDIVTDPISYVGSGVGVLARKTLAQEAATTGGKKVLQSVEKELGEQATNDLVQRLVPRTRMGQAAAVEETLQQGGALARTAGKGPSTAAELLSSPQVARQQAERELGNIVGEALYARGRAGALEELTTVLGSRDLAGKAYRALGPDFAPGLKIVSPLTGRTIFAPKRLPSAGPISAALNNIRLNAAVGTGRVVTKWFDGESGKLFQQVKQGIKQTKGRAVESPDVGRVTLVDFTDVSRGLRDKRLDAGRLSRRYLPTLGSALHLSRQYSDNKELWDQAFYDAFFLPPKTTPPASALEEDARRAADEIKKQMRGFYDTKKELGLELGDLGPNYSPLQWTDDEAKLQSKYARSGTVDENFRTERGRNAWVEYIQDPIERARVGFELPTRPGIVALDPRTINKRLGRQAYVEDPVKAAALYLQSATAQIATERFIKTMREAGVLVADVDKTPQILASIASSTLEKAARDLSPIARRAVLAQRDAREAELREALAPDKMEATVAEQAAIRLEAESIYRQAKGAETEAAQALREAVSDVESARQAAVSVPNVVQVAESQVSEISKTARAAKARLSRAKGSLDEANTEVEAAQDLLTQTGGAPEAQALAREVEEDAAARADKYFKEFGDVEEAQNLLFAVRGQRQAAQQQMSVQQQGAIQNFENAMARRVGLQQELDAAVAARAEAYQNFKRVRDTAPVERLEAMDDVVTEFIAIARRFAEAEARGVKGPELDALRTLYRESEAQFKKRLGYLGDAASGPAARYAATVVRLAKALSIDEFDTARVLYSDERLGQALEALSDKAKTPNELLGYVEDMVDAFKNIRAKVSKSDLEKFTTDERRLIETVDKDSVRQARERWASPLGRALVDEAGLDVVGGRMRSLYTSTSVKEALERVAKVESGQTEEFQKLLNDIVDPLLLLWRLGVTTGRGPAYTLLNAAGGLFNNYLGGVSAEAHKVSSGALVTAVRIFRDIQRRHPNESTFQHLDRAEPLVQQALSKSRFGGETVGNLFIDFLRKGGFESTQTYEAAETIARAGGATPLQAFTRRGSADYVYARPVEEISAVEKRFRGLTRFGLTNRVVQALNDVNQGTEVFMRFSAFLDGFAKTKNVDSAMDRMYALHFNYQDLSDAERWARRLAPFYTWSRRNIPLQIRAAFLTPSKLQKFFYLNEEAKNYFGTDESWVQEFLPEYAQYSGGFATMFSYKGNPIFFMDRLPYRDLDRTFQGVGPGGLVPIPRLREVTQMLGPQFTLPVELAYKRDLETGQELTGTGQVLQQGISEAIPQAGLGYRALSGIAGAIPGQGPLDTLAGGVGAALGYKDPENLRALSNLLNVTGLAAAAGGATGTLTPRTLSGEIRRRNEKVSREINATAEQLGVDPQWLRSQVSKGLTAQEIAILIASGAGTVAESEKSTGKLYSEPKRQREINKLLSAFSEGRPGVE